MLERVDRGKYSDGGLKPLKTYMPEITLVIQQGGAGGEAEETLVPVEHRQRHVLP